MRTIQTLDLNDTRTIIDAGIAEADGLHRTVAKGVEPALGHHFNRQASLEIGR